MKACQIIALSIGLVLVGCGCTSLSPSAASNPTYQEETGLEQSPKTPYQGDDWFWSLIYSLAEIGGSTIASK
jgi:hypothetical protein